MAYTGNEPKYQATYVKPFNKVVISLLHGTTTELKPGFTAEIAVNEYGNVYLDGQYVGTESDWDIQR